MSNDSLGRALDLFVIILEQLAQEWNRIIQNDQVALTQSLKQVLDHHQGGLPGLPLVRSCLHDDCIVHPDPHGIIVYPIIHLEDQWLQHLLNHAKEVRMTQKSEQVSDWVAKSLK